MVIGVQDGVAVNECIKRSRDADAPLGLDGAEAAFEESGVGRMHLQAHGGFAAVSPAALGLLPAEVVHAHPLPAVTEDAVLVARAFRTEVGVGNSMLEDAGRRDEVIEAAGLASRDGGRTNEVESAVWCYPIDRNRLDERVAVDEDDVLGARFFIGEKY